MIEIEEPPNIAGCSECASPVGWLYSPKKKAWISVVRIDDETFRLHHCAVFGQPRSWKHLQPQPADVKRRGLRRARLAAAAAAQKLNEKEERHG